MCRTARYVLTPPCLPVRRNAARQASGSSRDATTATASPSRPGTSRLSTLWPVEPISPLIASSSRPPAAPVSRMASTTQPRSVACRPARRHCSTTGLRSVLRAAMITATRPPAVAAAAASQPVRGMDTAVSGSSSSEPSAVVAARLTRTPSGSAMISSMAGSDSPKTSVRQRPRPRSLARAISGPRAQQQPADREQLGRDQPYRHQHGPPAGLDRREGARDPAGHGYLVQLQLGAVDHRFDPGLQARHVGGGDVIGDQGVVEHAGALCGRRGGGHGGIRREQRVQEVARNPCGGGGALHREEDRAAAAEPVVLGDVRDTVDPGERQRRPATDAEPLSDVQGETPGQRLAGDYLAGRRRAGSADPQVRAYSGAPVHRYRRPGRAPDAGPLKIRYRRREEAADGPRAESGGQRAVYLPLQGRDQSGQCAGRGDLDAAAERVARVQRVVQDRRPRRGVVGRPGGRGRGRHQRHRQNQQRGAAPVREAAQGRRQPAHLPPRPGSQATGRPAPPTIVIAAPEVVPTAQPCGPVSAPASQRIDLPSGDQTHQT